MYKQFNICVNLPDDGKRKKPSSGRRNFYAPSYSFSLAFFCTLYGSYPISVCWLILFYE